MNHIEVIIGKVLAGEASTEELNQVTNWLLESEANKRYFENLKTIFEKAASPSVEIQFDTDAAWTKVKRELNQEEKEIKLASPHSKYIVDWRIAASIIFLLGISWIAYHWPRPTNHVVNIVSSIVSKNDTLPDGSLAYLNKRSELQFSYDTKAKTRTVKLKGEAYFTVKHKEENPFIIEADEILVRDIGTEFNLKAYPDKDTIEIIVTKGEVQFYTLKNAGLNLKAGDRALYRKSLKEFYRIEKPDTNALAYKTKVFSFNNTDLQSVVNLLNDIYNSKIRLSSNIGSCRLTANFAEDNPNTIVEVIAETMGFTIARKDDEILLEGSGCLEK